MKDEVIKLTEDASNLINDFEDYMFTNAKEKYIEAKSVLDQNKETIELINDSIDDIDLETTKTDLQNIINAIEDAKKQLNEENEEEEIINNAAPTINENILVEETIDTAMETLNNTFENINFENESEQENNNETNNNVIETNLEEVINNPNVSLDETNQSDELDLAAIDAFLADNSIDFE